MRNNRGQTTIPFPHHGNLVNLGGQRSILPENDLFRQYTLNMSIHPYCLAYTCDRTSVSDFVSKALSCQQLVQPD
jgi:hypothetical protein